MAIVEIRCNTQNKIRVVMESEDVNALEIASQVAEQNAPKRGTVDRNYGRKEGHRAINEKSPAVYRVSVRIPSKYSVDEFAGQLKRLIEKAFQNTDNTVKIIKLS